MPRRFTIEQAQRLIPRVEVVIREAIAAKSEYDESELAIRALSERVTMMGGVAVDRGRAIESRARRDAAAASLRDAVERVHEFGCLLKDLEIGLIDFPTLFRGVEVYLCWKLGEPGIAYWHGVDEGFQGRKPIDRDFLDHHVGDETE
jgi:hypothetical protein